MGAPDRPQEPADDHRMPTWVKALLWIGALVLAVGLVARTGLLGDHGPSRHGAGATPSALGAPWPG